jgi:2-methylfumaryl-CoA hydratase
VIPEGLDFSRYDFTLAGEPHRWGDYAVGERIDHVDGVTIEEAEHMLATRLWQNTAKVHFDATFREDGKRLIYGGHVISLARALSFNGLANAQMIVALNGGAHANPCFAGRYREGLVRGAGQGAHGRAGRRGHPVAVGRGETGRPGLRAEGRRREIPARSLARS